MNTDHVEETILECETRRKVLTNQHDQSMSKLNKLSGELPHVEESIALIQQVAQETQNQLQDQLEDIIQTGLEICFPETYNARVEFITKRGKTECDIYLKNENGFRVDPLLDNGGGLGDVVSFSLRMACWSLTNNENVIILDEPFKFVSEEIKPLAGELLKSLSEKLNLQIIMVTHDNEYSDIADRVFKVNKNRENVSEVKEA